MATNINVDRLSRAPESSRPIEIPPFPKLDRTWARRFPEWLVWEEGMEEWRRQFQSELQRGFTEQTKAKV